MPLPSASLNADLEYFTCWKLGMNNWPHGIYQRNLIDDVITTPLRLYDPFLDDNMSFIALFAMNFRL